MKPDGIFYTYLYGRDSVPFEDDLKLFRERVYYNSLMSDDARRAFLLEKARGRRDRTSQPA